MTPKRNRLLCAALASASVGLALAGGAARAADGMDFGYRVDGPGPVRPTLIFNDGEDTYIQPAQGIRTSVPGAVADGPYLRLSGTPTSFTVHAGSANIGVTHTTLPSAPKRAARDDSYADMAPDGSIGAGERVVESAGHDASVGPLASHLGAAAAPVVTTATISIAPAPAAASPASVSTAGSYGLPPIIGGPVAVSSVAVAAIPAVAASAPTGTSTLAPPSAPVSQLALSFSADGIRPGAGDKIQIHFSARPSIALHFTTPQGKRLASSWDDTSSVMTVDGADAFVATDGHASVLIRRIASTEYQFPVDNPAGLKKVFDQDGSTYLEFGEAAKSITVKVPGSKVAGRQRGRFYRFNAIVDSFDANADGFDVTVTRTHTVRFADQPGGAV